MTSIESKEIKGVTIKGIVTVVICTISIVSTGLFTYFDMKSEIRSIREQTANDQRYNDLKIKSVELNMDILERKVNRSFSDDIKQAVRETIKELGK